MRWSENYSAANPRWTWPLNSQVSNFGPLALQCGRPFIIEGQPI